MDTHDSIPSREEADKLLIWASNQNPGPWVEHCRVVARAAETIAGVCGLDTERAYVSGLLHDIGRYEGVRGLHHIHAGYELLVKEGYDVIAGVCLSHSFPYQNIQAFGGGEYDCTADELNVICMFLEQATYNEYDKLIQLCDAIGAVQGICTIEKRLIDVTRRHGFNDFTLKKWDAFFYLKEYFDRLCGKNIYDLFCDEIVAVSLK